MISVRLKKSPEGTVRGFCVTGHAGQAPRGEDIVCAGVSAVVQTALIGLDEVADVCGTYTIDEGGIQCTLPEEMTQATAFCVQTILKTMALGLVSIAEQYPEYVRIKEEA